MNFSSNENILINLLNFEDYASSKYLSEQLYVSSKTIYRIIKRINNLFKEKYDEYLIVSEPGKGYKLAAYYRNKNISLSIDFSEENNFNELLLKILFNYPKKVKRSILANQYLSESTIDRRIKEAIGILEKYRIKLVVNREYIWLEGTELSIRKAINEIFLDIHKNNTLNEIGIEISSMDKHFIDSQLALIEEVTGEYINYPYDITIYTHIFMVIKRYREGKVQYLENQEPLEKEEEQLMKANAQITAIAKKITKNIEAYLNIKMNILEEYFIFQNIYSLNIQQRESSNLDKQLTEEVTKTFIEKFYNINDVTLLPTSRSLYQDLYQHILPMLNRLRLGIKIENNLLGELVLEYSETFLKLKKIADEINQELMFESKINDAEVGFLTLYFEKFHINLKNKKNVLLVCSTGIGTSELLKARVKQNFPNLNIVTTMSQRQVKNNKDFIYKNINLVFSTLRVPLSLKEIPILNISPLLSDKDIQNINYTLKEME